MKNQAAILDRIRSLIVPHFAQNWRDKKGAEIWG
jgi:hypothetical protein